MYSNKMKVHTNGTNTIANRKELSKADQVLCYIKSWSVSNNYNSMHFACVHDRFIQMFLSKKLGITITPTKEKTFEIVFDNFKLFKQVLNKTKGNVYLI